ncbi:MAG: polyprenyl synthetase family protein [Bacteroidota bacterium]
MQSIETYRKDFVKYLNDYPILKEPMHLYNPVDYILQLGGKRLRPTLALMTSDIFGANYHEAMSAAMAIEVFHNFSLIHDDIMDDAPLRRGQQTVHEKWDVNIGILSGDAMLIMSYRLLESYPPETFQALTQLFSKTALEVCEGQQYDIDFETRDDVTIPEYLKMIEYKTAVLVGAAMKMGAIIANATVEDQNMIYDFGRYLGIAFQLQDDYLDAFGNPETFGKQVGGDIIEDKKTYLYLKAIENKAFSGALLKAMSDPLSNEDKVDVVKHIFTDSGAASETLKAVEDYTNKAFDVLDKIQISKDKAQGLRVFGEQLMNRNV